MTSIIYIIVFIVLLMVIYNTFKESTFFQNANPMVMSICVTSLCVIGIHQVFEKTELDFLILPYAALGIALLSVLLLKWLSRFKKPENQDFEER